MTELLLTWSLNVNTSSSSFADDTNIFYSHTNFENINTINHEVSSCFKTNKLSLSIKNDDEVFNDHPCKHLLILIWTRWCHKLLSENVYSSKYSSIQHKPWTKPSISYLSIIKPIKALPQTPPTSNRVENMPAWVWL